MIRGFTVIFYYSFISNISANHYRGQMRITLSDMCKHDEILIKTRDISVICIFTKFKEVSLSAEYFWLAILFKTNV